jgi:PilZ domain
MQETSAPSERRSQPRYAVDEAATLHFIEVRAQVTGRILDLSMSGCRIRTNERFPVGIYRRVETEFKLDGLPFRLGGVVQTIHDKFTVGIRFLDVSPRKRDQLSFLMDEFEAMRRSSRPLPNEASPA